MDTEVLLFDKHDLDRLIDSDIFWLRFSRGFPMFASSKQSAGSKTCCSSGRRNVISGC